MSYRITNLKTGATVTVPEIEAIEFLYAMGSAISKNIAASIIGMVGIGSYEKPGTFRIQGIA